MSVESIIFIHDGFLISPVPPSDLFDQVQTNVLKQLNLFDSRQPLFRVTQLQESLAQLETEFALVPCVRLPRLPGATLHHFWKTLSHKRPRAIFANSRLVEQQETRLTKKQRGSGRRLKRQL